MGGVLVAAVARLTATPSSGPASPSYATVEARLGTLGRSIVLNASIAWEEGPALVLAGGGIVTELRHEQGGTAHEGDVIASVSLRPVTVARGNVPMFRVLVAGARGSDVRQLQELLVSLGHLGAPAVDGHFGPATLAGVKKWQGASGLPRDGEVQPGDIVFLPTMPTALAFADGVTVGARVSDGDAFVRPLGPPRGTVTLPDGQAALVRAGQRVVVDPTGHAWTATVGSIHPRFQEGEAQTVAELTAASGTALCGERCGAVPVGTGLVLPARVDVVPPVAGVMVPASAVTTGVDGRVAVIGEDGTTLPVTVVQVDSGQAIVEGLDVGTVVRAPALVPSEPNR